MKHLFNKSVLLFASTLLLLGCSPKSDTPKTQGGYFQNVKNDIEEGVTEEKEWGKFYDKDDNRFVVTLHYDLHFGLAIHIEEYDLWNFLVNANEGEVSEDAESITFTNSALEKTDLFKKGTYVLTHNNGNFTLNAAGVVLNLTTTAKEDPHYILKDLVGKFEYQSGGETKFTMDVEVGTKAEHYPVSISIEEGNKTFTGSNIRNNSSTTTFDISGTSVGQYIKSTTGATFTYNENNETFTLKIDNNSYLLTKNEGEGEETDESYFESTIGKVKFVCDDFEARVSSNSSGAYLQLIIKELVADGNTNIQCFFQMVDEDTLTNVQSIGNPKNKVFIGHDEYTFKHSVVNDTDKVDLYFDGVLAYENLSIVNIEA